MAEPTRFAILQMVRRREMPAGEIARKFKAITRPAVSQHLRVLKNAGLVVERREGTRRIYSLRPEGFGPLKNLLEDF
ncbi:MAG: metalloregulator ArsR/SmtB family transcription factor, partial [Nitrospinota bacterium]|nr:metalloregulator ArsR/SmtB family transcription factor [Nitrospinota bacterium]